MSHEFMAPLMFGALVGVFLLGYPVAFALAANGIFFALLGIHLGLLQPELLQALPERVFGIMRNDTLLAATTGVVAASVISMGLISLPIMMRYGYSHRLASGVIAASGTLAQIIPPSLVLIVLADQLGRSVGDMYVGAFIPGVTLAGLYLAYVAVISVVRPSAAPALPPSARTLSGLALARRVLSSLVPPLMLIFLVLGTIILGVATPTEGGAMGASGALVQRPAQSAAPG